MIKIMLSKTWGDIKDNIKSLEEENKFHKNIVKDLRKKLRENKELLETKEVEIKKMEQVNDFRFDENKQLLKELLTLKRKNGGMKSSISQKDDKISRLQKEIKELSKINSELKTDKYLIKKIPATKNTTQRIRIKNSATNSRIISKIKGIK